MFGRGGWPVEVTDGAVDCEVNGGVKALDDLGALLPEILEVDAKGKLSSCWSGLANRIPCRASVSLRCLFSSASLSLSTETLL